MHAADRPPRVFVSYSREDPSHRDEVHRLCQLLTGNGVDVRLDIYHQGQRHDWQAWITREITGADYVIVVGSPAYRAAGDGNGDAGRHRGVQAEAALLRELLYRDRATWTPKLLPVVLPGGSVDDLPLFLQPHTGTHYVIAGLTEAGIGVLLRTIKGGHPAWTPPSPPDRTPPPRRPRPRARQVAVLVVVGLMLDGVIQSALYHPPPSPGSSIGTTTTPLRQTGPTFPGPVPSGRAGPPTGCQQGQAAIRTYQTTVGSTWYSRQNAAGRAVYEIELAMSGSGGAIYADLMALNRDFLHLQAYASGQSISNYNTVDATTSTDIQTLYTDCGNG